MLVPAAVRFIRHFDGPRGTYTLRLAAADEAPILAHHRASMFRDMKEVDEQDHPPGIEGRALYEGLGFEPTNEMRIKLT